MARYRAVIEGNTDSASRLGSAESGIWAHICGWDLGIEVFGNIDPANPDDDVFVVHLTSGSNGGESVRLLGTFTIADLEKD